MVTYIFNRENLEKFLNCEVVKGLYYSDGLSSAYKEFIEAIRDVSIAYVYVDLNGSSNSLHHFAIAFNQIPENFDKVREYGLEPRIKSILTRDGNFFYELNSREIPELNIKKGFHKSPTPNTKL